MLAQRYQKKMLKCNKKIIIKSTDISHLKIQVYLESVNGKLFIKNRQT
jgi:hypothetical protein